MLHLNFNFKEDQFLNARCSNSDNSFGIFYLNFEQNKSYVSKEPDKNCLIKKCRILKNFSGILLFIHIDIILPKTLCRD